MKKSSGIMRPKLPYGIGKPSNKDSVGTRSIWETLSIPSKFLVSSIVADEMLKYENGFAFSITIILDRSNRWPTAIQK